MELNLSFIYSKKSYTGFIQKTLKHLYCLFERPRMVELEDPRRQRHHESRSRRLKNPRGDPLSREQHCWMERSERLPPQWRRHRALKDVPGLGSRRGHQFQMDISGRASLPVLISILVLLELKDPWFKVTISAADSMGTETDWSRRLG